MVIKLLQQSTFRRYAAISVIIIWSQSKIFLVCIYVYIDDRPATDRPTDFSFRKF